MQPSPEARVPRVRGQARLVAAIARGAPSVGGYEPPIESRATWAAPNRGSIVRACR